MSFPGYSSPSQLGVRPAVQLSTAFLTQSMLWMFVGLLITTGVGVFVSNLPEQTLLNLGSMWFLIFMFQIGIAFGLTLGIRRMSATLGLLLFFVYAATVGFTLGILLVYYTTASVMAAGLSAAAVFAGAGIYGATTKRNLTSMGGILSMALIGLLVALVVNMFIGWVWLNMAVSVMGVLIFTGLTAWDIQRIQRGEIAAFTGDMDKSAVMGAFVLYLDFINLFLFLLRLFGGRR
jgi:FtsH-binding integral membrane protein